MSLLRSRTSGAGAGRRRALSHAAPAPGRGKFYCLDFFPYPSGHGLSVGHGRNYVPSDVIARLLPHARHAVLHPMGWDAFGLPAENEAIKRGIHPRETTTRYAANYRRQMTLMGCSYDWEREINSSAPEFYRWTQWFFLLLYRRGLAYRVPAGSGGAPAARPCWRTSRSMRTASAGAGTPASTSATWSSGTSASRPTPINCWRTWTPGLAGAHRRHAAQLDRAQRGRGVRDAGGGQPAQHVCLHHAPGHRLRGDLRRAGAGASAVRRDHHARAARAVAAYREQAARRSDVDRHRGDRAGNGVFTGAYAVNPLNAGAANADPAARVPVYVADYVLSGHGSGAIMGVPAHDARDFEFAAAHGLPVKVVVAPAGWQGDVWARPTPGPA